MNDPRLYDVIKKNNIAEARRSESASLWILLPMELKNLVWIQFLNVYLIDLLNKDKLNSLAIPSTKTVGE